MTPAAGGRLTDVPLLTPVQYASAAPLELLNQAARGRIGFDHRLLKALVDRPEETVPAILEFARSPRDSDRIDIFEDLFAIARHLKDPRLLPFLCAALAGDPTEPYDDLAGALASMGKPAGEPVLEILRDLDEEDSGEVLFILALLRQRDDRIYQKLLEFLEFDASEGAFLLGVYGDPAAIPPLQQLLASAPELAGDIEP